MGHHIASPMNMSVAVEAAFESIRASGQVTASFASLHVISANLFYAENVINHKTENVPVCSVNVEIVLN
jgi:hypothetical protein